MDKIRQYLALSLNVSELPLNHLIGDVLFPPSLIEGLAHADGRVAPPYAKIGGGIERVPFYVERPTSAANFDAKGGSTNVPQPHTQPHTQTQTQTQPHTQTHTQTQTQPKKRGKTGAWIERSSIQSEGFTSKTRSLSPEPRDLRSVCSERSEEQSKQITSEGVNKRFTGVNKQITTGGCNENQILMKCSMDLRQFGLDRDGGFWMDMRPLCGDTECAATRAWITAPKSGIFCAADVRTQVERAIWALQILDPKVKNRLGEIYSVERQPGENSWYPVFLSS